MANFIRCIIVVAFFLQLFEPSLSQQCLASRFKVFRSGVSADDESKILEKINNFREKLSNGEVENHPRAINLGKLIYSKKLARRAQKQIETCEFLEKPLSINGSTIGTIHFQTASRNKKPLDATWRGAINGVLRMSKDFEYPKITPHVRNYIQLINERAREIGCGFIHFSDNTDKTYPYYKLYVCFVYPSFKQGEIPYEAENN